MTVKVTFEFTHAKDGIDVVADIESVGEGCCTCELAFATTTVENIKTVAGNIRKALKADPAPYRFHGSVH
ncbi:hypothetical protein JE599_002235 [Salmonella enterica]|nr:hypothetical protein [Salmonella enterica]